MRINRIVVIGALGAAALGGCGGITDDDIEFTSLGEVRSLHASLARSPEAALFMDARAPKYYAEGHIPGAVNYQLFDFAERTRIRASVEAFDELVVYGDNPGSYEARGLTKRLMEIGYSDVRLFAGGLDEWKAAGLPVEKGEAPATPPEP